jgi:excisionase family DNA binding protein
VRNFESLPDPRNAESKFYSVAEVAAMFGLSPMTMYRAIADGAFPAVRIRDRLIVPARAIEEMIEAATDHSTMVDAASWVAEDLTG